MNFLYKDSDFHFMNQSNYEQIQLPPEMVKEQAPYLLENMEIKVCFFNGRAVSIELPLFVNLKVTQTVPGVKGNTVSGGSKPATMETGLNIQVPLHIKEGDILKVDTRTATYIERTQSG